MRSSATPKMTYSTPAVEKIIHVSYQQNSKIAWNREIKREYKIICIIVEPLKNKHFGTTHYFVHYREVVFSLEAKIYYIGTSKCVFFYGVFYRRFCCIPQVFVDAEAWLIFH